MRVKVYAQSIVSDEHDLDTIERDLRYGKWDSTVSVAMSRVGTVCFRSDIKVFQLQNVSCLRLGTAAAAIFRIKIRPPMWLAHLCVQDYLDLTLFFQLPMPSKNPSCTSCLLCEKIQALNLRHPVRDPLCKLCWSKYRSRTLLLFGKQSEASFSAIGSPTQRAFKIKSFRKEKNRNKPDYTNPNLQEVPNPFAIPIQPNSTASSPAPTQSASPELSPERYRNQLEPDQSPPLLFSPQKSPPLLFSPHSTVLTMNGLQELNSNAETKQKSVEMLEEKLKQSEDKLIQVTEEYLNARAAVRKNKLDVFKAKLELEDIYNPPISPS